MLGTIAVWLSFVIYGVVGIDDVLITVTDWVDDCFVDI